MRILAEMEPLKAENAALVVEADRLKESIRELERANEEAFSQREQLYKSKSEELRHLSRQLEASKHREQQAAEDLAKVLKSH